MDTDQNRPTADAVPPGERAEADCNDCGAQMWIWMEMAMSALTDEHGQPVPTAQIELMEMTVSCPNCGGTAVVKNAQTTQLADGSWRHFFASTPQEREMLLATLEYLQSEPGRFQTADEMADYLESVGTGTVLMRVVQFLREHGDTIVTGFIGPLVVSILMQIIFNGDDESPPPPPPEYYIPMQDNQPSEADETPERQASPGDLGRGVLGGDGLGADPGDEQH